MTDGIEVWALNLDEVSNTKALEAVNRTETEQKLEDTLAAKPEMLMPGLRIVGRQASTESGYPDLLGFDGDGRLVVFELKRGMLTRDAIAQVLDYGSDLESRTEEELAEYVVECSGRLGVEKIEDFSTWYGGHFDIQEVNIKPVRMVLVGLGVDTKARRMVEYLQEREVNIELMTFHGFQHEGQMLLIKQVEIPEVSEDDSEPRKPRMSKAEYWDRILKLAREHNVQHLEEATKILTHESKYYHTRYGTTFINPSIILPTNVPARASHSVVMDGNSDGTIKIVFYPPSVHLCWDAFQEVRDQLSFKFEKPRNTYPTDRVLEQWYCLLDHDGWQRHKETLQDLVRNVRKEWDRVREERA
ncbi:MAG: endonuclease NucS [Alphaproteobacteria bacterium]|nr:endonuclease NucS [Alphaproteobacteria bacterium]